MGKEDTEAQTAVPYDRLQDDESTGTADLLERHQQGTTKPKLSDEIRRDLPVNGYQHIVPASTGMGGGEPQATSAEHEELFAQYREEDGKLGTSNDSEEQADHQMNGNRSKRSAGNARVNNRAGDTGATFSRKLLLANALVNVLMFAVAGYITYHCFNKAMVLFSWHPTFMSIGYLILMSQAVLTMSGTNYFTHRCHHRTKVFLHWLLQAVAGILITIASVCIFLNKIRLQKSHFQTLHGIFGLVTVCFTLASIAGGVTTKYAFQLRHHMRPIYSKLIHGIAGTVTYLLGVTTIGLGVYSHWFQEDNDANVRLTLVVAIGVIAMYVIIAPMLNTIQRMKTAVRSTL
ncbi:hypothetical protein ZHAS_00018177 [Anopheles sinensis]|uniref:ascorbate ferrireductase (transmembrane) n=1 Tax=Anopheles sinensis TaxID=74873 RepID=A0A084WIS7_ANOSI|nr:hypothetical protein ZHAS_00018177 [Anopheles sinensis]